MIEPININGEQVAIVIRSSYSPTETTFHTKSDDILQIGHIVYPAGSSIVPHVHRNIERMIEGTPEVLVVQKGKMKTNFYNDNKEWVGDTLLSMGDVILLLKGGHGFQMIEDTVLMEVKQGPYLNDLDKERFEDDSCK